MLGCIFNCFKNQKICNKAVGNCSHTLTLVSDWYKTQKICNKAVGTFADAFVKQFVPECFKIQGTCDKAVDICPFVFDSILDWYMTQEIGDKVVSKEPFSVISRRNLGTMLLARGLVYFLQCQQRYWFIASLFLV